MVPEVRVNSALSKDEQIKKEARINVTAYQGKVLLVGQSPNAELSARAKQIAMGVDGANEVYNEISSGASRLVWAKRLTIRGSPPKCVRSS